MISIIMPTYNRFDVVKETILKALSLSEDVEYELIVVNDGQELPFTIYHPKLSIFKNPQKGVAYARNFGASKSKFPILFFIDDDMWITSATLHLIIDLWKHNQLEKNYFNLNWTYPVELQEKLKSKKIGRYILGSNYHTLEGRSFMKVDYEKQIVDMVGVGSCSFCISKDNFNRIGGYNEKIEFQGEDTDIALRLKNERIQSKLATPVTCYHNQEDRLEIEGYIDRIYRGSLSQAKSGMIKMSEKKQSILKLILPFYSLLEWLFNFLPNSTIFDNISFRLIGALSSLSCLKAIQESGKST